MVAVHVLLDMAQGRRQQPKNPAHSGLPIAKFDGDHTLYYPRVPCESA